MDALGDISSYLDKDGYKVQIGAIVGYEEYFLNPDNEDKLYVILKMPNYGNTVIMYEIVINQTSSGKWDNFCIVDNTPIEVEPWKIGAI